MANVGVRASDACEYQRWIPMLAIAEADALSNQTDEAATIITAGNHSVLAMLSPGATVCNRSTNMGIVKTKITKQPT